MTTITLDRVSRNRKSQKSRKRPPPSTKPGIPTMVWSKDEKKRNAFLRTLIHPHHLGWCDGIDKAHLNQNSKGSIEALVKEKDWRGIRYKLTQDRLWEHYHHDSTFFFAGNSHPDAKFFLIALDWDCHKFGSLESAYEAVKECKRELFPDLYSEISTSQENGMHSFLIVEKNGFGDQYINFTLRRLETLLNNRFGKGVELIEVKGSLPEYRFDKDGLKEIKCGTLAKFPREFKRFEQLMKSRTTMFELNRLTAGLDEMTLRKKARIQKEKIASLFGAAAPTKRRSLRDSSVENTFGGSVGNTFSDARLKALKYEYKQAALRFYDAATAEGWLLTSTRVLVTVEDIAICLMILQHCTMHRKPDESLPVRYVREIWSNLYSEGRIRRGFDASRFAAIRNAFDAKGWLDWDSAEYAVGRCCRWGFTEAVMDVMKGVGQGEKKGNEDNNTMVRTLFSSQCSLLKFKHSFEITKPKPPMNLRRLMDLNRVYEQIHQMAA